MIAAEPEDSVATRSEQHDVASDPTKGKVMAELVMTSEEEGAPGLTVQLAVRGGFEPPIGV